MALTLVPKSKPSPTEEVTLRVKKMQRPDGALQCPHCGCRTSLTMTAGAFIKNGRKQAGTVIDKDVCAECWRRGASISMLPELKPVT